MPVDAPSRADTLRVAAEWCRLMAAVEPGGFARILAPDALVHGFATEGGVLRGPVPVQDYFEELNALCAPAGCEVLDAVVDDSRVALRWAMVFQQGRGAGGPSGQVHGLTLMTIRAGRIVELWSNFGRMWV